MEQHIIAMEKVLGRQLKPAKNTKKLLKEMDKKVSIAIKSVAKLEKTFDKRKKNAAPQIIKNMNDTLKKANDELTELKIQVEEARLGLETSIAKKDESVLDMTFLSGMNYCGPGTKIQANIANNVEPINRVDALCRTHDISYANITKKQDIRDSDEVLIKDLTALSEEKDLTQFEQLSIRVIKSGFKLKIFAEDANPLSVGPNIESFVKVKVASDEDITKTEAKFNNNFITFQEDLSLIIQRGQAEETMSASNPDTVVNVKSELSKRISVLINKELKLVDTFDEYKKSSRTQSDKKKFTRTRTQLSKLKKEFSEFLAENNIKSPEEFSEFIKDDSDLKELVAKEGRESKIVVGVLTDAHENFGFRALRNEGAAANLEEKSTPVKTAPQGSGVIRTPIDPESNIHTLGADAPEEKKEESSAASSASSSASSASSSASSASSSASSPLPSTSARAAPVRSSSAISDALLNALVANSNSNGRKSGVRRLAPFIKIEGSNTIRQSQKQMTETARDFANFSWKTPNEDFGGQSNTLYQMTEEADLGQYTAPLWQPTPDTLLKDRKQPAENINMRRANPIGMQPMNPSDNYKHAEQQNIKSVSMGRDGHQVGYKINFSNAVLQNNPQQNRKGNRLYFNKSESNTGKLLFNSNYDLQKL